ncbi:MAG: EAL domain-containing protein [Oscillospiraceae bacterium]|nr:EAL domain-containing protein [Oscillospiraceae bacterium]
MHFSKKSFINSLVTLICMFNVLIVILFIAMTYFITKSNTDRSVRNMMTNAAYTSCRSFDIFTEQMSVSMAYFAQTQGAINFFDGNGTDEEIVTEIRRLANSSDMIDNVWCFSSQGRCFDMNGEADPSALLGIKMENASNSLTYTDGMGLIMSSRYMRGDNSGAIYLKINIPALGENISGTLSNEGAYSVIYDDKGQVVYSPAGADALMSDADITLAEIGQTESAKILRFKSGNTENFFYDQKLSNGWVIAVIFDGKVAMGDFSRLYSQQIIILACLFALEIIATLNSIRHEAKDIPEISASIEQISQGNYNFRINSTSENEIGIIARSVDELAQTLQDKNAVIEDYVNLDTTTGLYNRYKMYEYIQDLAAVRSDNRDRFALLFLDIDNFKWVTETLGHKQGDAFLHEFGQRVHEIIPKVFRFSGDEFVVVTELEGDDYAIMIAELILNIRKQFIEPIELLGTKLYAQFSVGISIYPDDDRNLDMLLRDADIAMQRAKERGKGHTEYFKTTLHEKVLGRSTIAQKLTTAVENHEFYLVFQPIVSVENGMLHGFEALIRWENPELGYVPPSSFVDVAEETGVMEKIGTWIMESGCKALRRMNEYNKDIIMSINVSPIQLKRADFISKVMRTISIFDINPANLQIEITETSFVDMLDDDNGKKLQQVADMGVAIALDDFGTGYSSFQYLKDMPIKTLKVDKSFVDEISSKQKDYQIASSIIGMVRELGIKTVVEGVESIDQYKILSGFKCDYIQGFLMSKPLRESDALEFVIEYDELHKPNEQSLIESSEKLAEEKKMRRS